VASFARQQQIDHYSMQNVTRFMAFVACSDGLLGEHEDHRVASLRCVYVRQHITAPASAVPDMHAATSELLLSSLLLIMLQHLSKSLISH
jgi:hypothetical protein